MTAPVVCTCLADGRYGVQPGIPPSASALQALRLQCREHGVPQPVYDKAGITIYNADSRKVLPWLEAGSVDLVLTDPPYNVSWRNGRANTTIGRVKTKTNGVHREGYREIRRDFGTWDYDWDPAPFLAETCRLLRQGGSLVAFTSEFLFDAYLQSGLAHRCILYWHKPNPAPAFRKHYVRAIEMAIWQTKGGKWTFNEGGYRPNLFKAPIVSGWYTVNNDEARVHPNQKPLELIRQWLLIHSNVDDLVLDPFMGSGTTLRAAKDLGRRAIGIEIEERYCEIAARRLEQETLPLTFSEEPTAEQGAIL